MSKKYTYCFDNDDEFYRDEYDSREEAVEAALKEICDEQLFKVKNIFVGSIAEYEPYVSAYEVVDELQQQAYDQCGDSAWRYLDDLTKEDMDSLSDALTEKFLEWEKTHPNAQRNCYFVEDIEKYNVQYLEEVKQAREALKQSATHV